MTVLSVYHALIKVDMSGFGRRLTGAHYQWQIHGLFQCQLVQLCQHPVVLLTQP